MLTQIRGLVLRTTDINDTDRMLTIYSAEAGIISALAKGSRSLKSRKMAATMQFCYADFVIFSQGDKSWVREADLIENFFGIRDTLEGLALGGYVLEVMCDVCTAEGETDLLRLALNTLFAISNKKYALPLIKAAFEVRIASILGFMPDVISCHDCGEGEGDFFLDVMAGAVQCAECHRRAEQSHETLTDMHESHIVCILTEAARTAFVYCIYTPLEKIFSFSLGTEDERLFSRAAEEYLLNHLERGFKSLDFYNEVKR